MGTALPDVLVVALAPGDRRRAGRTLRALRGRGLDPVAVETPADLAARLGSRPAWLVRAGAWPAGVGPLVFPAPSATGRTLCALGAVRADGGALEPRWAAILAATGGDLAALRGPPPPLASAYLEAPAAAELAARLDAAEPWDAALAALLAPGAHRVVRTPPLDVIDDDRLRIALAITSLQQGGAERVVLDLFAALGASGVRPIVITVGRPSRAAFPAPPGALDVSGSRDRIAALAEAAIAFGADLIHGHLLTGDECARLAARGVPLAITIHNTRPGWPEGLGELVSGDAALLIACSRAAEADLAALPIPRRTIWNGIDAARLAPAPALRAQGAAFRRKHGLTETDLVLLAVANPRPQKRLERLPAVLAAARAELARRGVAREARLVIAGDADPRSPLAARAAAELRGAIAALGLEPHARLVGSLDDTAPALAAADALVSVSAHEGLSLAHLEALAAGLPVIATAAGGTAELAPGNPALRVLPLEAAPEAVAAAAVELALRPPGSGRAVVLESFTRERMAERHAALYRRAIAVSTARPGRGIVLITNNFSTGGAQSSARRLLTGLAVAGERARAVVLEEQAAHPTPGRRALEAAGIPVSALPEGALDATAATAILLERLDEDPPEAVLFWNALVEHKVRLADALLDVPVFDVSPGEMYFASLDRWLARPRAGLPYPDARAYGARLRGVIVKYAAEAERAAATLGAPVHVVPNGIDLDPVPAPRAGGARLVIGTAARLSPQKKLEDLLAALRLAAPALPPHVLKIAGGPERGGEGYAAELRRLAAGLEVEWLGDLADPRPLHAELDLFVMISEPAGCPNASLEAMAAGVPVIATDGGGASEQVVDGVTGRLVPRGDARAFAAALVELGRDAAQRRTLGRAARARVEERFDARRMVADYRRICLGR